MHTLMHTHIHTRACTQATTPSSLHRPCIWPCCFVILDNELEKKTLTVYILLLKFVYCLFVIWVFNLHRSFSGSRLPVVCLLLNSQSLISLCTFYPSWILQIAIAFSSREQRWLSLMTKFGICQMCNKENIFISFLSTDLSFWLEIYHVLSLSSLIMKIDNNKS